jgi:predicted phosphate transport protein (TIGR00153 family)
MGISLVPREDKFFELFEESAKNLVQIALALKNMLDEFTDIENKMNIITGMEHKGDSVTHEIMALLHRSFVTPFDREDIALLAHTMDDIADLIHASADAMCIYHITAPTPRSREMADILIQTTQGIERVIPFLRHKSELKKMLSSCIDLNRLENDGDKIYRLALGELFEDTKDTAYIIKWREIYEHMESATDRCEDVANVLEGVALKNE